LLVLSATPIPRSLALTLYGDLDLVTMDGVPPGRAPVVTRLYRGPQEREGAYQALGQAVGAGGQGFVVCPAVAESEEDHGTSAVTLARELRGRLGTARVGLLHGQLRADRQQAVADAFRARRLDVLVATTVVEVGIDVPGARIMIVEDAERFGLAQLHQLRGRVGRGSEPAACYLLTGSDDADALARLAVVAEVSDGFRIAEADLRHRGAGDVHGTRQTGTPELRFANPAVYLDLLESARREAETLLLSDPELTSPAHADLARAVEQRTRAGRAIAEEAG